MTYVRINLQEEEFDRLLELLRGKDDAVVYKLRAKKLSHTAKKMRKADEAVKAEKRRGG